MESARSGSGVTQRLRPLARPSRRPPSCSIRNEKDQKKSIGKYCVMLGILPYLIWLAASLKYCDMQVFVAGALSLIFVDFLIPQYLLRAQSPANKTKCDGVRSLGSSPIPERLADISGVWDGSITAEIFLREALWSVYRLACNVDQVVVPQLQHTQSNEYSLAEAAVDDTKGFRLYGKDIIDWNLRSSSDGINVWTGALEETQWEITVGRTTVDATVDQLVRLLSQDSARSSYDPMFKGAVEHRLLGGLNPELGGASVKTLNYSGAWPVADRSFLVATGWSRHSHNGRDGALVATRSVSPDTLGHPDSNAVSQNVRARIHVAGFWIQPCGEGKCELTMVSHVDFGGTMPASLINYVQTSVIPDVLSRARKLAPMEINAPP